MTRRPKRPRRRKHSPEEPLEASGTVLQPVERPPNPPLWFRPLRALVASLPVHEETRRGREFAIFVRLLVGLAAVMMVTKGRYDWVWGGAAILTALSTLVIPLSETRRRRWLRHLDALNEPSMVQEARPARVEFDGRKASIRVDERVWRSLRPFDPPGSTRLLRVGDAIWLGLIPPEGRKRDELWFYGPAVALDAATNVEAAQAHSPDVGMEVDADALRAIHEAFIHRLR